MAFYKSFPKNGTKNNYSAWEEVCLTNTEELKAEELAKQINNYLLRECIDEAHTIIKEKGLNRWDVARLAIALFDKIASHQVFLKERICRIKFDTINNTDVNNINNKINSYPKK